MLRQVHILVDDDTAALLRDAFAGVGGVTAGPVCSATARFVVRPTGRVPTAEIGAEAMAKAVKEARTRGTDVYTKAFTVVANKSAMPTVDEMAERTHDLTVSRRASKGPAPQTVGQRPRIAVAVSVHAPYLRWLSVAMSSVRGQTLQATERWLLCDGCEPPESADIDGWRVISGNWKSPGPGRNEVIAKTSCDWTIWLDADDEMPPDYIEAMVSRLSSVDSHRVGVVYPDLLWCDEELNPVARHDLSPYDPATFHRGNCVPTPSMWRVEALREIGGWATGVPVMDDWQSMMALRRSGWKALHQTAAPVHVRKHGENNSRRKEMAKVTAWNARRFAIVTLYSGRTQALEAWRSWLLAANIPPHCSLWILDDSRDSDAETALHDELQVVRLLDHGRFESITVRQAQGRVHTPSVADQHKPHGRVAMLYNAILPDVCRCSDFCLLLEDDVVPPANAFSLLAGEFCPHDGRHIAAVTGVYPARGSGGYVSVSSSPDRWRSMKESEILEGYNRCGAVPGGCTLYDSAALLECLPMRFTFDPDGTAVGWDGNTARRLASAKWQVGYHGDVRCEHRWMAYEQR